MSIWTVAEERNEQITGHLSRFPGEHFHSARCARQIFTNMKMMIVNYILPVSRMLLILQEEAG